MMARDYDAKQYWERSLAGAPRLDSVGNVGCGVAFNRWIYRQKVRALRGALATHGIEVAGADVFEAGFGIGVYLREWARLGARSVRGIDISEAAARSMKQVFPDYELFEGDISDLASPADAFDLVVALDVLYHIGDDGRWRVAVRALGERVRPGGWLVLSDQLFPRRETRSAHVRRRTGRDYATALQDVGLIQVASYTFTRFLGHDMPGTSRWALRPAATAVWRYGYRAVRVATRLRIGEIIGFLVGAVLYGLERTFSTVEATKPCLQIILAKRPEVS